jgi:alpha-tubulin suppressor-like RCC1 family protein
MAPPTNWAPPAQRGGYRPPSTRKNWIIGGVAALVLATGIFIPLLFITSGVKNVLSSAFALPSSGNNTVAWYWIQSLFRNSDAGNALNVSGNFDFTTIAISQQQTSFTYFVALDNRGAAYVWGQSPGRGAPIAVTQQPAAVPMPSGVTFTDVSTNNGYALALDRSGHLWSWGSGPDEGSSGTPSAAATTHPTAVPTPPGVTFRAISVGWNYALAVDSVGRVWSWGSNDGGTLAQPISSNYVTVPSLVTMPPGVTFTSVSAGFAQAIALDSSGRAWAWGDGEYGELGVDASSIPTGPGTCAGPNGLVDCTDVPLLVNMPPGVTFTAVAAGDGYNTALDSTGKIWGWGTNDHGAMGLASSATTCAIVSACATEPGVPQMLTSSTPASADTPQGVHFVAIAVTQGDQSGEDDTVALDSHGQAWAWGSDIALQFIHGTSPCYSMTNQPTAYAPGVELCVLSPSTLPPPAGDSLRGIGASTNAIFTFPR